MTSEVRTWVWRAVHHELTLAAVNAWPARSDRFDDWFDSSDFRVDAFPSQYGLREVVELPASLRALRERLTTQRQGFIAVGLEGRDDCALLSAQAPGDDRYLIFSDASAAFSSGQGFSLEDTTSFLRFWAQVNGTSPAASRDALPTVSEGRHWVRAALQTMPGAQTASTALREADLRAWFCDQHTSSNDPFLNGAPPAFLVLVDALRALGPPSWLRPGELEYLTACALLISP